MDSELYFEWPDPARPKGPHPLEPDALPPRAGEQDPTPLREARELQVLLDEALTTIVRLEADRHTARVRIEELEAARDSWQARLAAQQRRLLLLERQLEGAQLPPAEDGPLERASWLDRLLGGRPPTRPPAPGADQSLSTL